MARPVFGRARWIALAWLAVWLPAYLAKYGWHVFLNLCDIAVILTCVGLWTGNALLLSSQALSSLLIDLTWDLDLAVRALTGRHLVGGTEYMWDARWPLWLRLLSAFHIVLPPVQIWALRKVGYDRRGFVLQSAIAAVVLAASRLTLGPEENQNFAWADPFVGRSWGPAPVHVGLTWLVVVTVVYGGTHLALSRLAPAAQRASARTTT
jgi:hypothetical protein